jgi:hypothetical protein
MANRETFPASQSPLKGDVSGAAGATTVTVTGLQTIPVQAGLPANGNVLTYNSTLNTWYPAGGSSGNQSILINGNGYSDDYDIGVNLVLGKSSSPTLVNGA